MPQAKGLGKGVYEGTNCCLNIKLSLGFFPELQTEVEEEILEKYIHRSRDKSPGPCGTGCRQHGVVLL